MKIIVSESQYKLIESLIDEAKANSFSKDVKARMGSFIAYLSDNISEGHSVEFSLASGNKIVLECISEDAYVYTFKVTEDIAGILKKRDTVSIYINPGNGESEDPEFDYSLNKKIITTSDEGETVDLMVNASKKTGVKGDLVIPKIKTIKPVANRPAPTPVAKTSAPVTTPTPKTPLTQTSVASPNSGTTSTSGSTSGTTSGSTSGDTAEAPTERDIKTAMEMILRDENLKKAFYEAPSLWKLFVAELHNGQAEGKGIITVLHLVDEYEKKEMGSVLGGTFIEGRWVTMKPIKPFNVKFTVDDKVIKYRFDNLTSYQGKVDKKILGQNFTLTGAIREKGMKFTIEVLKPRSEYPNTFSCNVFLIIDDKKQRYPYPVDFQVDLESSEGFKPHTAEKKVK